MKMKYLKVVISVFVTSLILSSCDMGSVMIHEKQSPHDFDTTVATIQQNARNKGWSTPKVYDFQKAIVGHNQPDPGKIKVLKLCNPQIAAKMLAHDRNKYVSVMMPCSVSVFEKKDGKTYIASMNMDLMSKVMGGEVGDILEHVAQADNETLGFLQ